MAKRNAQGAGNLRKKTVIRNGKEYVFWEGRLTVGVDPGTGRQIRKSFSGKTQKEVREKMQAAAVTINEGTYQAPTKMTMQEWFSIWASEYLGAVKPRTVDSYKATIKNHLNPAFGAMRLQALQAHQVQTFCNMLQKDGLSPKTIKNTVGVLHAALQQAVELGYIRFNPASSCKLPRIEKVEIKPLDDAGIAQFMQAIQGHRFENVYLTTLFTGMREGEVLGLTWDCIDFSAGTILIKHQLQRVRGEDGHYDLVSPKNGKSRRITPAETVLKILKRQKADQARNRLRAGDLWNNPLNLVFTNEIGHNLSAQTVYLDFKKVMQAIGFPDTRFHDLRHSYAVAALRSGDDLKTVQENLGHYTAAFTLDVYGHVTDQMRTESANRMEAFIERVSGK